MTNVDLTDIRQFVFSWLPSALRGNISELACVLAWPFHGIHQRYLDYKREKTYLPWLLNYNWSVQSMEEMLNNYFEIDSSNNSHRIRIEDATASTPLRIYRNADNRAKKLGTLKVSSHRTWLAVPFVVLVPAEIYDSGDNVSTIRTLIEILKLYGLKFTIVRYE